MPFVLLKQQIWMDKTATSLIEVSGPIKQQFTHHKEHADAPVTQLDEKGLQAASCCCEHREQIRMLLEVAKCAKAIMQLDHQQGVYTCELPSTVASARPPVRYRPAVSAWHVTSLQALPLNSLGWARCHYEVLLTSGTATVVTRYRNCSDKLLRHPPNNNRNEPASGCRPFRGNTRFHSCQSA
jgi:hypothetical protein